MAEQTRLVDGVRVPRILYGTAWKEEETQRLTELALRQGFRGIDTANQRRHYHEESVGRGIAAAAASSAVSREELFLQTKFTYRGGQDHRLPYDPNAPLPVQVEQSFASSLVHLGTSVIDSYILHGPSQRSGLGAADREVWRAMEAIHGSGRARLLGISNVALDQLEELCRFASVPPRFVQNRCYASRGWDREVRRFCRANGIIYQGFSLLTANRDVLASPDMAQLAGKYNRSIPEIVFGFALALDMLPLTGTTSPEHMSADLRALELSLEPADVKRIERLGEGDTPQRYTL
jgi:diketogulonate reductase-like aldo/keto reductase